VNERTQEQDDIARLAAIVEGSEDAIIGYGLDGITTDWNQAATRLYGYSAEEAIGKSISVIVPPSRAGELTEILNTVSTGGRIRQLDTVRQRKDGSLVEVSFSVFPITTRNGTVIGGASMVRDITSRKQVQEELRRGEERFRLLAQATKDTLSDWDIGSGAVWRSDNFWEQFGYSRKGMEPDVSAWRKLIHPEDRARVLDGFQTSLARHADSYEVEYRFRRADDSYAVVLERTYIIYGESGKQTRALSAMTDLSDRRELEEQFRQAQKMEAVGRLAGGIAHDFNNLLMVIGSYAEMMRDQLSAEDGLHKSIAQVQRAADRAASLTQQLMAFSRKQVLSPRIIDLNTVIEDGLKITKRLIGEDIALNILLGKDLWAIKADPGQVGQVLMNLCINARDAMRSNDELTIGTDNVSIDVEEAQKRPGFVPGNYVALVVRDTGTGMTEEVQAHLFDPFFTTKEMGKGTGLGLSMVYGIVKQSGGYISVESQLGRGSTFTIYFPAVDEPLTMTITPETRKHEGHGEIILLVEDEDALRESMSAYLEQHGYKVLAASNGAQALHFAKRHAGSIQALVTDIILPKLSGVELAREVNMISPKVVTLYMSGYTDRELMDYDPETSAAKFLQKPFALRALLETIGEMIARRE
jgi:PAS domain S-box-containing protein